MRAGWEMASRAASNTLRSGGSSGLSSLETPKLRLWRGRLVSIASASLIIFSISSGRRFVSTPGPYMYRTSAHRYAREPAPMPVGLTLGVQFHLVQNLVGRESAILRNALR